MKKDIRFKVDAEMLLKIKAIRSHYGLGADTKAVVKAIDKLYEQVESFNKDKLYFDNTSKRLSYEFTNKIEMTLKEMMQEQNQIEKGL